MALKSDGFDLGSKGTMVCSLEIHCSGLGPYEY